MTKVKLLATLYPYGKNGQILEIPDSEVSRLGSDIEVLEEPKKTILEPKNRKVKSVKLK